MPFRISLIAIDIDGTLVTDDNRVLPATRSSLKRALDEGLQVILATGRRYRSTWAAMEQLSIRLPAVCLGGALIKSRDGETLHSEPFPLNDIDLLLALARKRAQPLVLQRDANGREGPDFVVDASVRWNEPTRHYVDAGGDSSVADVAPERGGYDDILMVGAFGERDRLRRLRDDIAECGGFTTVLVKSKRTPGWYLETTLGHVDKWTGVLRFAALGGIDATAICTVGDAANDLPMIRGAALGVAMGNADPRVRQAADWTTGNNEENGVASLIERLLDSA